MKTLDKLVLSGVMALGSFFLIPQQGGASVTDNGITYSLSISPVDSVKSNFTLTISGINGSSDTEKGRSGVNAFAFNNLPNLASANAPTGFSVGTLSGGLGSSGCNGSGSYVCFKNNNTPGNYPALAANSVLVYTFSMTSTSAYNWKNFDPSFRIDWVGSKYSYDLVGRDINPNVAVPEPTTILLLSTSSLAFAYLKKRKNSLGM